MEEIPEILTESTSLTPHLPFPYAWEAGENVWPHSLLLLSTMGKLRQGDKDECRHCIWIWGCKKQDPHHYDRNHNMAVKAPPGVVCSAYSGGMEPWRHTVESWRFILGSGGSEGQSRRFGSFWWGFVSAQKPDLDQYHSENTEKSESDPNRSWKLDPCTNQIKHVRNPVFTAVFTYQMFYDDLRHGLFIVICSMVSSHQPLHCPGSDDESRGNTMSTLTWRKWKYIHCKGMWEGGNWRLPLCWILVQITSQLDLLYSGTV